MLGKEEIEWLKKNIASQNVRVGSTIDFLDLVDKINRLCPELNCPVCNRRMYVSTNAPAGYQLTIEHITPVSKGGTNNITNLFPLCGSCNSSKKDKTPEEWGDLGKKLLELNYQYHPELLEHKEIIQFDDISVGQYFWKCEWTVVKRKGFEALSLLVYEKVSPVFENGLKYEIVEWHPDGGYIREITRYDREQDWYPISDKLFTRPHISEILYKQVKFGNLREGETFRAWSKEYIKISEVKKRLFIFNHKQAGCNAKQLDNNSLVKFSDDFRVVVSVGELKDKAITQTSHFVKFCDIPVGELYTYWLGRSFNLVYQKIEPIEINGYTYDHIVFNGSKIANLDQHDEEDTQLSYITGNELIRYTQHTEFWGRRVRFKDIGEGQFFIGSWPPFRWIKRNGKAVAIDTDEINEMEDHHRYIVFDIEDRIHKITPLADVLSKLKSRISQSSNMQKCGFGAIEEGANEEEIDNLIRTITSQVRYTKHNPIIAEAKDLKPGDKFEFIWRGEFYKGVTIGGDFFSRLCILFVNGKKIKAHLDGSVKLRIIEKANNEV